VGVGVGAGRSMPGDRPHPRVALTKATAAIRIAALLFFPDFILSSFLGRGYGRRSKLSVPEASLQSGQLGLEFLDPTSHTEYDLRSVEVNA
jgi:hypothetical protein